MKGREEEKKRKAEAEFSEAATTLVPEDDFRQERKLDRLLGSPPVRYKSFLAVECHGITANLKVDYDLDVTSPRRSAFREALEIARSHFSFPSGFQPFRVTEALGYRTRKGIHLRAWTNWSLPDGLTLHVQEVLGDDPKRVEFNRRRVARGAESWNVLWNAKFFNGVETSRERLDPTWTDRFRGWLEVRGGEAVNSRSARPSIRRAARVPRRRVSG